MDDQVDCSELCRQGEFAHPSPLDPLLSNAAVAFCFYVNILLLARLWTTPASFPLVLIGIKESSVRAVSQGRGVNALDEGAGEPGLPV